MLFQEFDISFLIAGRNKCASEDDTAKGPEIKMS